MPRRRKTDDDEETNRRVGDILAKLRRERGWKLEYVASSLGLSVSHVSALEGGQYTFSVAVIERVARLFQRPPSTFLRGEFPAETLEGEWQQLFARLPPRDRVVLLDLAKKLSSWPATLDDKHDDRAPDRRGFLVSLEGIDGDHLHVLGTALAAKGRGDVVYCPHDYGGALWQHMIERIAKLDGGDVEHAALERTLLFGCERLARYEEQVAPALREGKTVVAPFFAMASSVYQETEGVGDRRLSDIVEALLPRPDVIVMLRSDAARAAKKAVPRVPEKGQFYSPYGRAELAAAKRYYEKAAEELGARGLPVNVFDAADPLSKTVMNAVHDRIARLRSKRGA